MLRDAAETAATQLRSQTPPRAVLKKASLHYSQRTPPPCFIEEVNDYMGQESHPVANRCFSVLIPRRFKRPVDEHGPPDHVFFRNKTPKATVQAHIAVVSHREIMIGRHYEIVALNVHWQFLFPRWIDVVRFRRRHRRKIIAIRIRNRI